MSQQKMAYRHMVIWIQHGLVDKEEMGMADT